MGPDDQPRDAMADRRISKSSRHFWAVDVHGQRHMLIVWTISGPLDGHPGCWVELRKEVRTVFNQTLRRLDKGKYEVAATGESYLSDDSDAF